MKKILFVLAMLVGITSFAQGTFKKDNQLLSNIQRYDLSSGDTEYILYLSHNPPSFKWEFYLNFTSLAGTLNGTAAIWKSTDEGTTFVPYPDMAVDSITANGPMSFEDNYTTCDQLKLVITVNGITGGYLDVNERLISNPNQ